MNTKSWLTENEIAAQPAIWEHWSQTLADRAPQVQAWISQRNPDVIWLCGAGTSAFIGDALASYLSKRIHGIEVHSLPTTDLVARPQDFFKPGLRPLVAAFSRSGNSSETIGLLDLLDRHCPKADRLNITCNGASALATREQSGAGEQQVIVLPEECHDQGFAMTSSYTTMLLTTLACLSDCSGPAITDNLQHLAQAARVFLQMPLDIARPERAVFLGSGPFLGTARESALKVLELSAGQVVTAWDSTLGFRHGPKAITNSNSAVFIFLSSDAPTRNYDTDVLAEIRKQFPETRAIAIGAPGTGTTPDIVFSSHTEDVWNTALYILVAQRLAVAWSKDLSLNVDNPFEDGSLTRIVSHVQLYI